MSPRFRARAGSEWQGKKVGLILNKRVSVEILLGILQTFSHGRRGDGYSRKSGLTASIDGERKTQSAKTMQFLRTKTLYSHLVRI